jgi:hypothetical protein
MRTSENSASIAYCTDIGLHGRRQRTYRASYARKGVDAVLLTSIGPITMKSAVSVEMRSTRRRYNGPNYVLKRLIREIHSPAPYDHDAQEVYSGQTDHEAFRRMLK